MKKIFSILCIALGAMTFCACSNDDTTNPYATDSTITIVKSDVNFGATAAEGSVVFEAKGTVTAESASDWCTATVDGNTVKLSVKQNVSVRGRSTVVKLTCGTGSVNVSVVQQGVVFNISKTKIVSDDNARTISVGLTSNVVLSVEHDLDWLDATMGEASSVDITFAENNTGHVRKGYIKFRSEDFVDSVMVIQADYNKDIAGIYTLYYTDIKGRAVNTRVTLTDDEMQIRSPKLNVPISYDPETMTIKVECGQYCGKVSSKFIYVMLTTHPDENGGIQYTQYEPGGTFLTGTVEYGPLVNNEGKMGNSLALGGYFYEAVKFGGMIFWQFSKQELSASADAGFFLAMFDPYLERVIQ